MSNPLINPTKVIIPVDAAIAKTTHWRNFMAENFPETDVKALPKAVYISKSDIQDMARYCEADDSILGVRAYFTLENEFKEGEKNEVKFIMVLVKDTPGYYNGQDLLYIPPGLGMEALSPDGGELDDSNVYDFTRPCPDCCDLTSPLFNGGDGAKKR
ncbi:hypothetical protein [Mucilaginibacter boryungensis]|uniref:Uncharacterized protein n=1 Tax=Mucilaginibacter boryungensis TaxID=768480 RepID=A0ABR9XFT2_9SPHI|nr:hypothetical protein [Mucilaginibacter boryungensis]MBE9666086.1 hypothetical protein [Mucilaginibacter boryungensis]